LGEAWHQLGPISAEYFYTGVVFNNTRGGISTKGATRYRGNLDLALRLDTAAANWWDGGELYVYMQQSQGTTLTPDFVGDVQSYSNIDTIPKHQWLTQLAVDGNGVFENNYGFYATIDRMLVTEEESDDQGLGLFFQYCWAPSDRNQVEQGIGGGLIYTGLLQGRDVDTCGVGCSQIQFSPELEALTGQKSEIATEVFYKARLNDWFSIIPDLQYITSPSGLYSDAMVAGFRFEVNL